MALGGEFFFSQLNVPWRWVESRASEHDSGPTFTFLEAAVSQRCSVVIVVTALRRGDRGDRGDGGRVPCRRL
eukprot:1464720-Prymnesium_polylepis.1